MEEEMDSPVSGLHVRQIEVLYRHTTLGRREGGREGKEGKEGGNSKILQKIGSKHIFKGSLDPFAKKDIMIIYFPVTHPKHSLNNLYHG